MLQLRLPIRAGDHAQSASVISHAPMPVARVCTRERTLENEARKPRRGKVSVQ
jgi:hypothetical protein